MSILNRQTWSEAGLKTACYRIEKASAKPAQNPLGLPSAEPGKNLKSRSVCSPWSDWTALPSCEETDHLDRGWIGYHIT